MTGNNSLSFRYSLGQLTPTPNFLMRNLLGVTTIGRAVTNHGEPKSDKLNSVSNTAKLLHV